MEGSGGPHQATNDFERASKARVAEHELISDFQSEAKSQETADNLSRSIEQYQLVQKQIIELESNLQRSMDDAIAVRKDNPARAELLTIISKAIKEDIDKKQADREVLAKKIKDAGGDPAEFTLH